LLLEGVLRLMWSVQSVSDFALGVLYWCDAVQPLACYKPIRPMRIDIKKGLVVASCRHLSRVLCSRARTTHVACISCSGYCRASMHVRESSRENQYCRPSLSLSLTGYGRLSYYFKTYRYFYRHFLRLYEERWRLARLR